MELRHLKYFIVAAELQHFHKAAHKLCITQPALSNQIKQLEEELNTSLFLRIGRNVKLSEAGELVLDSAKRIFKEVDFLRESVADIETGQAGCIKIGILQSINALYLKSLVIEFDKTYPNISLDIEEMANQDIERKVSSGDIDIGVGFILEKKYKNVVFEKIIDENWKLVLSPQYANLSKDIMSGNQHSLKAILLPEYFETRKLVNAYFLAHNIKYRNITTVNTISSVLDLIENGKSFTILPEAFSVFKNSHNLAVIDLSPKLPPRKIGILTAKDRTKKIIVNEFCQLIKNKLS